MSDLTLKSFIKLHPDGKSGEFRSPDGLVGCFIFPSQTAQKGAAVSTTEMIGEVCRRDDDFSFNISGWPRFTLRVERTASGRIPIPPSYSNEQVGPFGC